VAEALADIFAYDYDREDTTWGEDAYGTGPPSRNWADPGAVNTPSGGRYPALMRDYDCTSFDVHVNSTILSHAYYRFVQKMGHPVAGHVLHNVVWRLPPRPQFVDVKDAFLALAAEIYAGSPQVATAARQAFVDEVAIGRTIRAAQPTGSDDGRARRSLGLNGRPNPKRA
jgi:Zn-dependent metalloprotease